MNQVLRGNCSRMSSSSCYDSLIQSSKIHFIENLIPLSTFNLTETVIQSTVLISTYDAMGIMISKFN